jgi:hypothetical protein
LEGASNTLDLFRAEGHGRSNNRVEEGSGGSGGVVGDGWGRARGDIFSNEVGGGFRESRAFFRSRRVDNEVGGGEGRAKRGSGSVAV